MKYDVTVIGGGPGGIACAVKSSKLGLKTALVEKNFPGGDAINEGYYPLKVLLSDDEKVLPERIQNASFAWHDRLRKCGVDVIEGEAEVLDEGKIKIITSTHTQNIHTKNIVIATGNVPVSPVEGVKLDGQGFISYQHAMKESKAGELTGDKIAILGADVEGCEFASFFRSTGKDVSLFETLDRIMPLCDKDTGSYLYDSFVHHGIKIKTNTKVTNCSYEKAQDNDRSNINNRKVKLEFENSDPELFDRVLLTGKSIPKFPEGLDKLGISCKDDGYIKVDSKMKTSVDGIYAIGDVIGGITSANAAILEGRTAAVNISGIKKDIDYSTMPYVFFTNPQISAVGLREMDVISKEIPYKVGKIDFRYNLRALSLGYDRGFVKVLVNPEENIILGIHIIGDNISELIPLSTLAYSKAISTYDITDLPLPHPIMGEIVLEAIEEALYEA
ncbi:dihydrolipoyl dehydrogenase family protein [Natranaerofaba carboxydovora]|uniref:dihydrolipoyl dehydrogenase family protein n=1 Tax=Natranaerofaba carboxydovora TaxID=2742683 RepID=UPI001F1497A7|nr:FAD-dependent oxidoreductase [Natranaerofaba carboxydovora]UMZ74809.1 Dihydrolipoyl dehydrogenase [Natranaerofaba carboxydovora]